MKSSTIAILAVVAVVFVAIGIYTGMTLLGPKTIEPNKFDVAYVRGLPSEGTYTFYFSLRDSSQTEGTADGSIRVVVKDSRNNVLYDSVKEVKASEFKTYNVTGYGSFLGYAWDIPSSAIDAGAPYTGGTGQVTLTFTTKSAFTFSKATTMSIPALPVVEFDFEVTSDGPQFVYGYSPIFDPCYANDLIEKTISFAIMPQTTIYGFSISQGFTLVSIDPVPPVTIGLPGSSFDFTIRAPNHSYNGPLVIQAITKSNLEIESYSASYYDWPPIYAGYYFGCLFVRNGGSDPITIQSVLADGISNQYVSGTTYTRVANQWSMRVGESASNIIPAGGIGVIFINTNVTGHDGTHTVRVIGSDGVPLDIQTNLVEPLLSFDSYSAYHNSSGYFVTAYLRNTGNGIGHLDKVYIDGTSRVWVAAGAGEIQPGGVIRVDVTVDSSIIDGTAHQFRVIMIEGATLQFSIVGH